jgi:hypothetical protein
MMEMRVCSGAVDALDSFCSIETASSIPAVSNGTGRVCQPDAQWTGHKQSVQ